MQYPILSSPEESFEQVDCLRCRAETPTKIVSRIFTPEALETLLAGETNRFRCSACGHEDYLEAPVLLAGIWMEGGPWSKRLPEPMELWRINMLPLKLRMSDRWDDAVQFLPAQMLEEPDTLDWLLWNRHRLTVVHSMAELVCQAHARIRLLDYLKETGEIAGSADIREIEIPPAVLARIRGKYRKGKLKVVWYVSTRFEEGREYSPEEVFGVIAPALSLLNARMRGCEARDVFAALCRLGFLIGPEDGSRYWRNCDLS